MRSYENFPSCRNVIGCSVEYENNPRAWGSRHCAAPPGWGTRTLCHPVWRERCCEALAPLRVLQVPLVSRRAVQCYCILRHMQQSVGINNGSTLLSIKIHPLSQSVKMLRILLFCDKNCAISAILALTFAKI